MIKHTHIPGQPLGFFSFGFKSFEVSLPVLDTVKVFLHQNIYIHLSQNHPVLNTDKHF